jgi:xanthine dehydrogenase accessory factor
VAELMITEADDLLEHIATWHAQGKRVALATLVRGGSSLRPIGSQLAVADDGTFHGSISGGCIEGAVIAQALASIADGQPRRRDFVIGDPDPAAAGLACGGRVQVYIVRIDPTGAFEHLLAAHRSRRPAALVTRLTDGAMAMVDGDTLDGDLSLTPPLVDRVHEHIAAEHSSLLETDPALFVWVTAPMPRLLLVGAVHIAQILAPMARLAGFAVIVIDPRPAFADPARFPGIALITDAPDTALLHLAPDPRTAVVVLAHDPRLDDPALTAALASPAFYIGALGSRRTQDQRLERLRRAGLATQTQRIHGPVGLDLGGRAPAEIAVAILAEIIQTRYPGSSGRR